LGNVTAVNVPSAGSWLDPEWISGSIGDLACYDRVSFGCIREFYLSAGSDHFV